MTDDLYQTVDTFIAHWQNLPRDEGALIPHVRSFLDHVEPSLQPHVALVDINARDDWTLRLYGTGRVNSFGRGLSGINPIEVYAPNIRPLLQDSIMTLLAHPCGWKSTRLITTVKGMTYQGSGLTLPLAVDDDKPGCIVNFMVFGKAFAHNDRQGIVEAISSWEWIDIGAGTPKT